MVLKRAVAMRKMASIHKKNKKKKRKNNEYLYIFSDGNLQNEFFSTHKWRYRGRFNEKSPLETLLSEKLNEVISEGILDSILPFICAVNLPVHSDKIHINHTCGLKINKSNAHNSKLLSPRIAVNKDKDDGPNTSRSNTENSINLSTTSTKERNQRRKSNQSIGLLTEFVYKN